MTYILFIIITGSIGILGAFLVAKHNNWPIGRLTLPPLSVLFLLTGLLQYFASTSIDLTTKSYLIRISIIFHFLISFLLLELIISFLGKDGISTSLSFRSKPVKLRVIWRPAIVLSILIAGISPWFTISNIISLKPIHLTVFGELLFSLLFSFHLLILFLIEKIFRSIPTMQKRIFMPFFSSVGIISIGSMVVIVRMLFYQIISFEIIQFHSALCGIFFPGIIFGVARYRLWREHFSIGRGIVYTSITILFFGIFLITLGIVASFVRFSGLDFNEFEEFVIIFSLLFVGVLTIFSPQMRKNITALSRKYIYKSKYDYRDQLVRLHNAHQSTGTIHQTIKAFIDNLQYTIIVKHAFVLVRSYNENSFFIHDQNLSSQDNYLLRANSPLVKVFERDEFPVIGIHHQNAESVVNAIESERHLIATHNISHLFAIKNSNSLLGILCIQAGNHHFDSEDLLLITMFCESIGTALFRDKNNSDHIQRKQFESFNHMAAFMVHDIKNQVATLSLLTKNARSNIADPDFHPVLLRSLDNCSSNLTSLIEKLQSPPSKDQLQMHPVNCNTIFEQVILQTKAIAPSGIVMKHFLKPLPDVTIDESALYFTVKNLLINAMEALKDNGTITCFSGTLSNFIEDDTYHFSLTPSDRNDNTIYLMIEDNGPGMSREFLENSLFKPFSTTKDKGIGIGLYQCKTLIESMNGRLLCWSETGKGTRFCILL